MLDTSSMLPGPDPAVRAPDPSRSPLRRVLPVCEPLLDGNELAYLQECIAGNWISSAGRFVKRFEETFAARMGCAFGVSCSSGTAALHLSLKALGIGGGDEVILPTFTMIAVANAVSQSGAHPVLVDVEPLTWNLDPAMVHAKITPRTRAIVAVHTYGHPADLTSIASIAAAHGLHLIEDAAEAHGATWEGKPVGSFGTAGCFSFYGNKIISTGEGGMVTTNDEEIAARARLFRDHAVSSERHFWHVERGFNYRMSNLEAAVGLAQTERLELLVDLRRRNTARYNEMLRNVPGLRLPFEQVEARSACWVYPILVDESFGCSRDDLRAHLALSGIETRSVFIPIHLQPAYSERAGEERHPIAEDLCRRGLYLPSSPTLTDEEISFVARQVVKGRGSHST